MKKGSYVYIGSPNYDGVEGLNKFIEDLGITIIKVGYSSTPSNRVKSLSSSSVFTIREEYFFESPLANEIEKFFKFVLKGFNDHGEWFFVPSKLYVTLFSSDLDFVINQMEIMSSITFQEFRQSQKSQKLTTGDKRIKKTAYNHDKKWETVESFLEVPENRLLSNRSIAAECKVSKSFVKTVRNTLGEGYNSKERLYRNKYGSIGTMSIENISGTR